MRPRRLILLAVAVAAVVAAAVVGVSVGTSSTRAGFCAYLPDSIGLYPGNQVTQMGYPVGSITRVAPAGDHVRVTFDLTADRRFPATVTAVTRSKSLLADRSLELVGNYRTGEELTPGSCIALDKGVTPKSLSEITGSAADFLDALSPATTRSVADSIIGLDESLRGEGANVDRLIRTSERAMTNPDPLVSGVGAIIDAMAPLTDSALSRWGSIRQALGVLPEDLAVAADSLWPGVTIFIGSLGPLIADLYDVQTNYGEDIDSMLEDASAGLRLAASRSGDVSELLAAVPAVSTVTRAIGGRTTTGLASPQVELRSPGARELCATINRVRPGSCTADGDAVRLSSLSVLDAVLTGSGR
ncbi:MlaD family protein [Gordonia shandongensis]|uniref:MlaD family protein n=1 Tax=Gordonia shandongensis TaxID=376351 RepID=UPI0003FCBD8C|nr:MlaD family protein [Gordonia shandongensis]